MKPTAVIARLDKVFAQVNLTDRAVYKRTITRIGGDALLGKPGSVTTADTLLSPQPVVRLPRPDDPLVAATGGKVLSTDYVVSVTPTAMTKAEIANKDVVLVFKEGSAEEEMVVVTYVPTVLNGVVVMFTILARSKKK